MRRTNVITVVLLVLLVLATSGAASVRISFLDERTALRQTLQSLEKKGCTRKACGTFERMVERYNSARFEFDLRRFPKARDGFYSFESVPKLVAALPRHLFEAGHEFEFTCFDTVIGLTADSLRVKIQPDEESGPYLVPYLDDENIFRVESRITAREAFTRAYPSWYRTGNGDILDGMPPDRRICLTAALYRCYYLPVFTLEETLSRDLIALWRIQWRALGMIFPKRFEVVLCHEVNLPRGFAVTAHAGLLFPRDRGFLYIEKAGGRGPFTRIDFDHRADLIAWLGASFRGAEHLGYTHHFVTFNDQTIEALDFIEK